MIALVYYWPADPHRDADRSPSLEQKGEILWERCEKFLKQIAKYEQDMLSTMPPLHLEVLEQSLQSDNEEEEGSFSLPAPQLAPGTSQILFFRIPVL